jgi:DNA-binding NarL/FixJ family response regulator
MSEAMWIVYLADDRQLIGETIASTIETHSNIAKVRVFHDGESLYRAFVGQKPHLIFLDLEMKGWSGIKTLEALNPSKNNVTVIILSMVEERSIIKRCFELGACGYLHKDSKTEELFEAIETCMRGEKYFSHETQRILDGKRLVSFSTNEHEQIILTDREKEILKHVCEGLSNKEIGEILFISDRTVETHKRNIMDKFGVSSTGKLITLSLKANLV